MELNALNSNEKVNNDFCNILNETEAERFLFKFQIYLSEMSNNKQVPNNKHYSLKFYRNLPSFNNKLAVLSTLERKLLKIKVNSLIAYIDELNKIRTPSPFVIGVFTAVISLVLGVMVRVPVTFPGWTIILVVVCFVLFIPGISWLNLEQSGKNAELKEVLTIINDSVL